jgi:hypothetical protein
MTAATGAVMQLAGWKFPVVLDLSGVAIPRQNIPIRMNHEAARGVGHTNSVMVQNGMLIAAGVISRDTESSRDIVSSSRNGFPWRTSVGASVDDLEFIRSGEKGVANGRQYEGPINLVRRSTLGEISFVDSGADPYTEALVAGRGGTTAKDPVDLLNDAIEKGKRDAMARIAAACDRVRRERERAAELISTAGRAAAMIDVAVACAKAREHQEAVETLNRHCEAQSRQGPHGRRLQYGEKS